MDLEIERHSDKMIVVNKKKYVAFQNRILDSDTMWKEQTNPAFQQLDADLDRNYIVIPCPYLGYDKMIW